jgi:signal transduction histidine kinase/ligand-binding sensor domain-containing protein
MRAPEERRNRQKHAWCLSLCLLTLFLVATSVRALDPGRHLSQYGHTSWRMQDGILHGAAYAITQTRDGYLWIGTRAGLIRFDGVRFTPWVPPGSKSLPSSYITSLLGARDGSLWIGTEGGLSHWVNRELVTYPSLPGRVSSIIEDRNGSIWVARLDDKGEPLCQFTGTTMRCYGKADGISLDGPRPSLTEDAQGNLWIGAGATLIRWRPGSSQTYTIGGLSSHELTAQGLEGLAAGRDGSIWVGMDIPGPGLGMLKLTQGTWKPLSIGELHGDTLEVGRGLLLDREDDLWIGTLTRGLYRVHGNTVEHFGSAEGLSGDCIHSVYEDREGNLWVATTQGIDFFRDIRVASFSTREGLGTEEVDSVIASQDGTVWVGGADALNALHQDKISSIRSQQGLPGSQVTSLFEDHSGQLWVGIDNTISIYRNGKFEQIRRSDGTPLGVVVGITEDHDGNIWVETVGNPRRLFRIRNLKIQQELSTPAIPAARRVAADPQGGIWMGMVNGDLARYQQGKIETIHFEHSADSRVEQIAVQPDGSVLGATTFGLSESRNGKQQVLTVRNGLPCNGVNAFVYDDTRDLWLYTQCGLVRIKSADIESWLKDPNAQIRPQSFDEFDGVQPGRAPFQGAARSNDGRLWFANGVNLQMIDPAHLNENATPPPVQIEEILADRRSYGDRDGVLLPPLTRDIEIDYTALSFVIPQKVRFRYMLDGRDTSWREAGTRRQAFYTDLRPGRYKFRVTACNNDGVWNETGAALDFRVDAAWYQTTWFRMLCVLCALVFVVLFYRYRVRQLARVLNARFDERLAERTRMARELHDTFVQTIQGSKLVADDALDQPNDPVQMRRTIEQLSLWLGQAVQEGRAALNSLRNSATQTNDLAAALRRATETGAVPVSMAVSFTVIGSAREMHPIVRDEIYRIGYEAIRNACLHSGASQLEVEILYADDLTLRVRDNGIGIDPLVSDQGKEGHFGLSGMRERAGRIGGKFSLSSSAQSGTAMTLVVPGDIIFLQPIEAQKTLLAKIKTFLSGKG